MKDGKQPPQAQDYDCDEYRPGDMRVQEPRDHDGCASASLIEGHRREGENRKGEQQRGAPTARVVLTKTGPEE
jgi:hypothetical protein